jgi:hypothetical protein
MTFFSRRRPEKLEKLVAEAYKIERILRVAMALYKNVQLHPEPGTTQTTGSNALRS